MPTRQTTAKLQRTTFGQSPLPTGYSANVSDFFIPSVTIEDVDRALHKLVSEEIGFQVSDETTGNQKIHVVFQAGEKWALRKKMRSILDRNGTIKLPVMSVLRTTLTQDPAADVNGRGINQQTGEIVVKRRLSSRDRDYQSVANRLGITNQSNVLSSQVVQAINRNVDRLISDQIDEMTSDDGDLMGLSEQPVNVITPLLSDQPSTTRTTGDLFLSDINVQQGAVLKPDRKNNVYEFIVVPAPQFFTATYEVTLWAQYTQHMNQLLTQLMSSFLPQGNSWRLDTPAGYWFIAVVDTGSYQSEGNEDDFSDTERLVRYGFTVTVKGYLFAPREPGQPIPVRRYVSAPQVSFDVTASTSELSEATGVVDPFLGASDPTLPMSLKSNGRDDQLEDGNTLLYKSKGQQELYPSPQDPALQQLPRGAKPARYKKIVTVDARGKRVIRYVRAQAINSFTGEQVGDASAMLGGISIVLGE